MNSVLKALIGAACIVVIAVGGHYAYARYSEHRNRVAVERAAELDKISQAGAAKAAAEKALVAECNRRVPSQSTEALMKLFEQCLNDQRPYFAAN